MNIINYNLLQKKIQGDFYQLCNSHCSGMCERFYLSYYMPNEDKYIARKLRLPIDVFRKKYVTVLKFSNGSKINLLKIANPCPFLDKHFQCMLEKTNSKLIACKMYPFYVGLKNNRLYYSLDYHCPLTWNKLLSKKFILTTKKTLKQLKLPRQWLMNVQKLNYFYDYSKLTRLNQNQITYEQLQKCVISE
jgi:Fe-S-cluster containining protein